MNQIALVAIGVCAAIVAAPAPLHRPDDQVVIVVTPPSVKLAETGVPGEFSSANPSILRIKSQSPHWRLFARFEGGANKGHKNIIQADQVWLEYRDLRMPGAPILVSLASPVELAEGGAGPFADILSVRVIVRTSGNSPPGPYTGNVRFYAVPGGISGSNTLGQVDYGFSFNVTSYVRISTDPAGISLVAPRPGTHESVTPMWVDVESNREHFRLTASMTALIHEVSSVRIPAEDTAIAWGTTPELALSNVRAAAWGSNQGSVDLTAGQVRLYIAVKARNDFSTTPGLYRGTMLIEVVE